MSHLVADLRCQPIVRPVIDGMGDISWRTIKFEALDPTGVDPRDPDGSYDHDLAVTAAASILAARWNLGVSVNFHPGCLETPGFPQEVIQAVAPSRLEHDRITLELTESGLVNPDDEDARFNLAIFCGTGFNFGLDDMGSPGSHVATTRQVRRLLRKYTRPSWQLTLRTLKIDRSLVARSQESLLKAFLRLGTGREIVIEGPENEDDLRYLMGLAPAGTLYQGYHIAPPLAPADFEEYLQEERLRLENEAVLATV